MEKAREEAGSSPLAWGRHDVEAVSLVGDVHAVEHRQLVGVSQVASSALPSATRAPKGLNWRTLEAHQGSVTSFTRRLKIGT